MKRTKKQWAKDIAIFGLIIIASILYFYLNTPRDVLNIVKTFLDDGIPRLPVFTIFYLAFLPWLWGVIFYSFIKNKSFRPLAISLIVVNLIASLVYIFFQTYVPREVINSNDIFSDILKFIYSNDQAYNGFPSLHSALSTVIAVYFVMTKNKYAWAAILIAILIVASTLFTKQHFVLDVVSGVGLGWVVTWVVFRRTRVVEG